MREVSAELKELEAELNEVEAKRSELLMALPNLPDPEAPDGEAEEDAVTLREVGEPPESTSRPVTTWISASRTAGSRWRKRRKRRAHGSPICSAIS